MEVLGLGVGVGVGVGAGGLFTVGTVGTNLGALPPPQADNPIDKAINEHVVLFNNPIISPYLQCRVLKTI